MPKRDQDYMQAQRASIAAAALTVLLEKGVYETSLRDICRAAGISIGALYIHFKTKEDAITAACALDHANRLGNPVPATWDEYIANFFQGRVASASRSAKRFRLSLQFVAELTQMDHNPEGLASVYLVYREDIARSLSNLHRLGIVDLPFGLEQTTEMHMQIFAGAEYQLASDRDLRTNSVLAALRQSLTVTAGLSRP